MSGNQKAGLGSTAWGTASDHVWKYFELHAGQRMALFNFFIVFSGFVLAGIGAILHSTQDFSVIGVVLGGLLALLSFVFWKLDQRMAFLVKHAELAQMSIEKQTLPVSAHLFGDEENARKATPSPLSFVSNQWTVGRSFRLTFAVAALIGLCSSTVFGLQSLGIVNFQTKSVPVLNERDEAKSDHHSSVQPKNRASRRTSES